MANPYSYDLRQKVLQSIELDSMKKSEAAQIFGISRNTIDLWLKRRTETGDYQAKPKQRPGNGHKITDWEQFRSFAAQHGDKTQAEMAELWSGQISARTISRALYKIGFTRKKRPMATLNAPEGKRQAFIEQLVAVPVSQRVYVDEAGMDNRDEYGSGWNERGQRFHALKTGRRAGRVNMIAAWCAQQLLAPFTVDGACNRVVFETWVETCLVPLLQPGQVVILDNATFHKGGRIQQLVERAGARLLYLPPYSPDLNKIEHCWSWLHLPHSQVFDSVWMSARYYGTSFALSVLTALAIAITYLLR